MYMQMQTQMKSAEYNGLHCAADDRQHVWVPQKLVHYYYSISNNQPAARQLVTTTTLFCMRTATQIKASGSWKNGI